MSKTVESQKIVDDFLAGKKIPLKKVIEAGAWLKQVDIIADLGRKV